MAERSWQDYSSDINETMTALDGLFNAERTRRALGLERLRAAVADDVPSPSTSNDEEETIVSSRERDPVARSRRPEPPDRPWVPLPQITGGSGPFGPKVREKLIREALAKRGWL